MPSDYGAITRENKANHDETINRIGAYLSQMYADQTHFVYELLQNAEDVRANKVEFRLFRDRLEFEHDGVYFDKSDIQAISRLVFTNKADDPSKIGKFGVGFMSVYAFTRSPKVYSGDERFVIKNYESVDETPYQATGLGTRFILPFDHPDLSPASAFKLIAARLEDLGVRTLLFLNSIKTIGYDIQHGESGIYLRQTEDDFDSDCVNRMKVESRSGIEADDEDWLVFERPFGHLVDVGVEHSDTSALAVKIAFQLEGESEDGRPGIRQIHRSPLTVFFPTSQETNLGFLAQGSYNTISARNEAPKEDLPDAFQRDETLAHALGMRVDDSLSIAKMLDDSRLSLNDRQKLELINELPSHIAEWAAKNRRKIEAYMYQESRLREQLSSHENQDDLEDSFEKPSPQCHLPLRQPRRPMETWRTQVARNRHCEPDCLSRRTGLSYRHGALRRGLDSQIHRDAWRGIEGFGACDR